MFYIFEGKSKDFSFITVWTILFLSCFAFWLYVIVGAVKAFGDERIIGYDYLAAQHPRFNVVEANQFTSKHSALGTLDFTFGAEITPISNLLGSDNFDAYRVHFINGPGLRGGVAAPYEITYGYTVSSFNAAIENRKPEIISYLKKRLRLYKQLALHFVGVKFIVSPMLEHNLTAKAYRVLADTVLDVWPSVQLDNNGLDSHERYRGSWIESHGVNPGWGLDISSLDGDDATDIAVQKWLNKTVAQKITYVWTRSYNCRCQGAWEDPRSRKSCPKAYQFEEVGHIVNKRPPKPSPIFQCQFKPLEVPFTWKPMAEDKCGVDPRANLPVALLPGTTKPYSVVALTGTVLGNLTYYGVFQGSLNRYYSGWIGGAKKNGFGFEKEASLLGSPWVWLRQANTCYGPFVPGRRAGTFYK